MAGSKSQHATATIRMDGLLANLIDNKLYTATAIAEQFLAEERNVSRYETILAALRQVSERDDFKAQVDGILKVRGNTMPAWYGSTWKEMAPVTVQVDPMESSQEVDHGSRRRSSGGFRSMMRMAGVAVVVLVFGIFIGKGHRAPFEPSPSGQHPILVLNCPGSDTDSTVRQMVETILEPSGPFRTVPASRVEGFAELHYLCDNPDRESLISLADHAGADFVLWGNIDYEDDELVWNGNLYQRNGGKQPIMARAPTPLLLSETIAKSCLSLLDSDEDPMPALSFFSTNPGANFLYSEAMVQYNQGNVNGALPFFERAGAVYDPNFYMARNMWARCLYQTGDVKTAQHILEQLLEHKDEISQPALVSIFRSLSRVYFYNRESDAFQNVISEAISISRDHYKSDYLYFLQLEAYSRSKMGDYTGARSQGLFALERARKLDSVEALVSSLFYMGLIELDALHFTDALPYLDEGLAAARKASLTGEEVEFLDQLAYAYVRLEDSFRVQSVLDDLQEALALTDKMGLHEKSLTLQYRIGFCLIFLNEDDLALEVFDSVARQAQHMGHLHYEVRAKVVLIGALLKEGKDIEAERLLQPFYAQVENLRPQHAMWIHDSFVHIYFHREEYQKALDNLSANLRLAEKIGDNIAVARNYNNYGEVLEKLGRFGEAEAYYLKSLEIKVAYSDRTIKGTLENLIRFYTEQGDAENAETYSTQLNSLD